jgi:hypothetical protein
MWRLFRSPQGQAAVSERQTDSGQQTGRRNENENCASDSTPDRLKSKNNVTPHTHARIHVRAHTHACRHARARNTHTHEAHTHTHTHTHTKHTHKAQTKHTQSTHTHTHTHKAHTQSTHKAHTHIKHTKHTKHTHIHTHTHTHAHLLIFSPARASSALRSKVHQPVQRLQLRRRWCYWQDSLAYVSMVWQCVFSLAHLTVTMGGIKL